MGLFSKRSEAEPVRKDQVMRLIKLGMELTDAGDRSTTSAAFAKAKKANDNASYQSTPAELAKAHEALRRHGY